MQMIAFRFVNKVLRMEDIGILYQFRFYITDLSHQLEIKFAQLKEEHKGILRLYRGVRLSIDEVKNFQKNTGNLISPNGYLSTSRERSVACVFATKSPKREGTVGALFEFEVDLSVLKSIVLANTQLYSYFPEEAEVIFDFGQKQILISIKIIFS